MDNIGDPNVLDSDCRSCIETTKLNQISEISKDPDTGDAAYEGHNFSVTDRKGMHSAG